MRDGCDSFSLAASATSFCDAPKWAIIVSCVDGVSSVDYSVVDDGGEQAEDMGSHIPSKKKLRFLNFEPNAAANAAATAIATAAAATAAVTDRLSIIADFAAGADPWSLNADGTMRTPAARRKAKSRCSPCCR